MFIKEYNCFYEIVPLPESISLSNGSYNLEGPIVIESCPKFQFQSARLKTALDFFEIEQGNSEQKIILTQDFSIASEGYSIIVTSNEIKLSASSTAGITYAIAALIQMLAIATTAGKSCFLAISCGTVHSTPRLTWRGFMLDCARHFRSKETIIKLLHVMAHFHYNVFHWHLTDNEAWRTPSKIFPKLTSCGELQDGFYTYEDITEITAVAKLLNIKIVPELDLPGHSRHLLKIVPQIGCINGSNNEVCIGNYKTRQIISQLLEEFMELFPESTEIHLGGDEANSEYWEMCPDCQKALKEKGLSSIRDLEHDFVLFLIEQVQNTGRKAIVWNDAGIYPADVIVQIWVEKNRLETLNNGNQVILSNCSRCYTDRLFDWEIQFDDFQKYVDVQDNYMFDPYTGHEDFRKQILGLECCSWGEYLPERRFFYKIMPRLMALSEVCCCDQRQKSWTSFVKRSARQVESNCENIW